MQPFTAYRNEFTGRAYQTPEGCLKSEFDHLRQMLHVAVDSTLLLPWLDFGKQCDYLRRKIDALEAKGLEYQQATDAKHQGRAFAPAPADHAEPEQETAAA